MNRLHPERRMLLAAGSVAVAAAIFAFQYLPLSARYREVHDGAVGKALPSGAYSAEVREIVRLRAVKEEERLRLDHLRAILRVPPGGQQVFKQVSEALSSLGVSLGQFSPLPVPAAKGGGLHRCVVHHLVFQATYSRLVDFLREVERLPFALRPERLKVEPSPEKGEHALRVSLHYSVFAGPQEAEEKS
jgi:hypothetical protein